MNYRELSKFQIKAEITLILQKLTSLDEMSKEQQLKYLAKLFSIKDNAYVVEVLAKELSRVDYKKGQIICLFLQELANLEQLSETLWGYIKSPASSDELRDLSGIILKNLGDNTDPEEFLNYLENPKAIVDKETKKLLEIASVNPEAQIDFLDFLFSLPQSEQFNLINSLKEDYSCEALVNVLVPAFESRVVQHMDEILIEILGETKSIKAGYVLKEFVSYSKDEKMNKKAKISLNKLKLSGLNLENIEQTQLKDEITEISDPYEFHTNLPDGLGNQGIIASRERKNGDIFMMNTVINDVHGILDCFGFYGISKNDFRRVVEKFQEKSTGIPISPEYCKYIIEKAEKTNKANNLCLPYEYTSWKCILSDIKPFDSKTFDNLANEWVDEKLVDDGHLLYKFPDFNHWFFEEDDHCLIKPCIEKIKDALMEKKAFYLKNPAKLEDFLNAELNNIISDVFSPDIRQIYKSRLQSIAFLLNIDELQHFRNIAASLAWLIDPEKNLDISKNLFFREIIKKTIIEGLLRYQHNLYNEEKQVSNPWNARKNLKNKSAEKPIFEKQNIEEIINILCGN
ncbi:MAG TPA: hypothetical protein P5556_05790 [Candidatus Gastranaerophilales bacterium]|nr:hypothetical protein [Candidatus Gastranaerophilales bacterium]